MTLAGKVVLVTGATGGIGRATVTKFADKGARVVVHYHSRRKEADALLERLPAGDHLALQADLGVPTEVQELVTRAVEKTGRIDVLVNNAGVFGHHPVDTIDYAEWLEAWRSTIAINLMGPANLCFCAAREMIGQGGGKVINVSSRGAFRGEPDAPAYGASKAGLNALSQSLAKALASHAIYVYAVAPGFVDTEMAAPYLSGDQGQSIRDQSPLGRVAEPVEIANTIVFLASEGTDFLTGAIVDVNGASYLRT